MSRTPVAALGALLAVSFAVTGAGARHGAAAVPADRLRAINVVPPGESGFVSVAALAQGAAGTDTTYGAHVQDQLSLYANWRYKPFQFRPDLALTPVPGDAAVLAGRDPSDGVPVLVAQSERDLYFGIGYAMATDRLFQMEVFRHVGHGTLADLTGPTGFAMDIPVRQSTEGPQGRAAELARQPQSVRDRLSAFSSGVNQRIGEVSLDPTQLPAEFGALGDVLRHPPSVIDPWTDDDTLAFGEYAGRFFGQFGDTEVLAAKIYADLAASLKDPVRTEKAFTDIFPLQDPLAPTTIPASDGEFPRHTGTPVAAQGVQSPYANHDPAALGPAPVLSADALALTQAQDATRAVQQRDGIPLFGSNSIVVSGKRTAGGNPMLYGGPQTGFSIPGYFWEVEVHDPVRDERGVMVPAIPLIVIGRNADAAWTVTSGLDANEDIFVEQLDASNTTYVHNGQTLTVQKETETVPCTNPPTDATKLLGGLTKGSPSVPPLCPIPPQTVTVYHTVHGSAIMDPDSTHRLYVRQSAVDGRLLDSLSAWDGAGLQHDVRSFFATLAPMALCFNFSYVDAHGDIGYWHVGKLPIRPANVDPNLPLPGDGRYDWQGFESFDDLPHDINPPQGYLVNWNNKPAVGWWSPSTKQETAAANAWSTEHQVVALQQAVASAAPFTLDSFSQIPRDPAYVDNPARILMPYVVRALATTTDATLTTERGLLAAWNQRRVANASGSGYASPAVVFFDRLFEHLTYDVVGSVAGVSDAHLLAGVAPGCTGAACHLVSVNNLDTPTMKWELTTDHLLLNALLGRSQAGWLSVAGGADAAIVQAAKEAAQELAAAGTDPAQWNEPVETTHFNDNAIGAAAVQQEVSPLPNRGSYGQAVEALTGSGAATVPSAGSAGVVTLTNTGAAGAGGLGAGLAVALGTAMGVMGARRRRSRPAGAR